MTTTDHVHTWEDQLEEAASDLTKNDRFSAVLVVIVFAAAIGLGLLLRQQSMGETWPYISQEAGIEGTYPAGWLTDEEGSYVVRIRDPKARPYKTQYQITVVPAGGQTSIRNVLDNLTLQRSVSLPAYRVLSVEEGGGAEAVTQMEFVFVQTDPNPFIERLPVVVRGLDRVVLDGNRAVIVTYMAEEASYFANLAGFERFVASLRY